MKVTQIYEILNTVIKETLGETAVVNENLNNIVDIGNQVIGEDKVDNYVKTLINHIGKVVFVNRPYGSRAPSLLMDGWEYGSILEKIECDLPDSVAQDDWQLTNGTTYNQDIFNAPKGVRAKFWNKRTAFEVDFSYTAKQVKESFSSVTQLNGFFSMIENRIRMRLTIDKDNLIMRTVNNLMAQVIYSEVKNGGYSGRSGIRAINLLYEYNNQVQPTTPLTVANCLQSLDFLKFAARRMMLVSDRMTIASTLFNAGGRTRFTPKDLQHFLILSDFQTAADVYLQADTYHDEYTKLPKAEQITYWQGTGSDFTFDSVSKINVTIDDGSNGTAQIELGGVIGCIFDHDAAGVSCPDSEVTSHYNAKGGFTNFYYKEFAGYFNDLNENCVVFYIA